MYSIDVQWSHAKTARILAVWASLLPERALLLYKIVPCLVQRAGLSWVCHITHHASTTPPLQVLAPHPFQSYSYVRFHVLQSVQHVTDGSSCTLHACWLQAHLFSHSLITTQRYIQTIIGTISIPSLSFPIHACHVPSHVPSSDHFPFHTIPWPSITRTRILGLVASCTNSGGALKPLPTVYKDHTKTKNRILVFLAIIYCLLFLCVSYFLSTQVASWALDWSLPSICLSISDVWRNSHDYVWPSSSPKSGQRSTNITQHDLHLSVIQLFPLICEITLYIKFSGAPTY